MLEVEQIDALKAINVTEAATERTIAAQFRILVAAGSIVDGFNDQQQLAQLLDSSLETFPNSQSLINSFASAEYDALRRLASKDPKTAKLRLKSALARLNAESGASTNVERMITRIRSVERRIDAAQKQQQLIGKPAPPIAFDGWANTEEFSTADLQGKVVLYDFWAVWCGPCIATFPHLREWREAFGMDGFEIVGVTNYYNYAWDAESKRATQSEDDVDSSVEQDAVARFLQANQMQHPTLFLSKESTTMSDYGVTGIPHAVLVDRKGRIQMVKVGSQPENAESLHTKIKELIQR